MEHAIKNIYIGTYVHIHTAKEHTIQIFADGSKNEHGVRSGTAIYTYRRN